MDFVDIYGNFHDRVRFSLVEVQNRICTEAEEGTTYRNNVNVGPFIDKSLQVQQYRAESANTNTWWLLMNNES
jgi:uncharacterized membrane-anchored protein